MSLDKQDVIDAIMAKLEAELALALAAADAARETATSKENVAENKYDTLGLEAAYLAHGQSTRVQRLIEEKTAFAALSCEPVHGQISLGALACLLDAENVAKWFYLGPGAAGLKVPVGEKEVTVITPESPLGASLIGKERDETVWVNDAELEIVDLY